MPAHRCFLSGLALRALLAPLLLLAASAHASTLPDFVSPQVFPAGGGAQKIAVADFNQDGKLDAVVLNVGFSILFGNGDGTFQPPVNYATPPTPLSVAVGDFNNDGFPDLAVGTILEGVTIYINRGDGTFQAGVNIASSSLANIVVGDFNGDHNQDLVLAPSGSDFVYVYLGHGDGTFKSVGGFRAGGCSSAMASGDFNHDGKVDLALTIDQHCAINNGKFEVSILLGNGDGSFRPPIETSAGPRVMGGIAVADFNHDGNLDVAIENNQPQGISYVGNVEVFLGNGDGTLQHWHAYLIDLEPGCILTADFNGDGNSDLAACSQNGDVSILYGNGDGQFQRAQNYQAAPSDGVWAIAAGDLNGDGLPDILTPSGENLGVLLSQKSGGYDTAVAYQTGPSSDQVAIGDFTGDGIPDVVVSHSSFPNSQLTVSPGIGNGYFRPQIGTSVPANGGDVPIDMAVGDFNRDGKLDVAISEPTKTGPAVAIMLGNGDGTFTVGATYPMGTSSYQAGPILAGDLNGDGFLDLVTGCGSDTSWKLCVILGNGDGTFGSPRQFGTGGNVALADLNHDGILDLVVTYNTGYDIGDIAVWLGKGDGTFQNPVLYTDNNNPGSIAIADLNGDGIPDLAISDTLTGEVRILLGNGDGSFRQGRSYSAGTYSSSLTIADFNHDGKPDIAIGAGDIVVGYTVGIMHGNGDGSFQAPVPYSGQAISLAVGDLTGCGGPDLVVLGSDAVVYLNSKD
jgi:FG-GAP-like repeat